MPSAIVKRLVVRFRRDLRPNKFELSSWRPAFLGVVQIHPGLDICPIRPAVALLGRLQVGISGIAPSSLRDESVPYFDFLFTWSSPGPEAPVEHFFIRSALQGSRRQLFVVHAEKSRAACIETSRIFRAEQVSLLKSPFRAEPDLVQHSSEID